MRKHWQALQEVGLSQRGHFTTEQAADCGVSVQLLNYSIKSGRIERVYRGVYRFLSHPVDPLDDCVGLWLWTNQEGVFSHQTALGLHGLGDDLPQRFHMLLPPSWKRRLSRRDVPSMLQAHFGAPAEEEIEWHDCFPITSLERSIIDYARDGGDSELVERAIREGVASGTLGLHVVQRALSVLYPEGSGRER